MSIVFPHLGSDSTVEQTVPPSCPECGDWLALHQPDAGLPDHLMAVCEACTAWFLSDARGLRLTPIAVEDGRRSRRRGVVG